MRYGDAGSTGGHPVVFFDGICNLCNALVAFVIRRDRSARFRFATLQSASSTHLVGDGGVAGSPSDSIVLVEDGRTYRNSTAVLLIARRLRFPWPAVYALIAVPAPLRDWVYRLVARNRYRWFGRGPRCMVPAPELRERFLP
ncbi:MAG: thiol-disulfide oxidoreductase DCC family protein [Bryobacteraceae bacterium]